MVFILIGSGLLYFFIVIPNPVPFYGWIMPVVFILIPALILNSLTFNVNIGQGFSEKKLKEMEGQRESLLFDEKGIALVMPLMGATWFIRWPSIETIIYTDYRSDDHAWFEFTLDSIPDCQLHENRWWLAKLFPSMPKRKWARVNSDAKNFSQLPQVVKKYLESHQSVDYSDSRKGTLISRDVEIKGGITTTREHWIPKRDYEPVQLIFDRQKRTLDEINHER